MPVLFTQKERTVHPTRWNNRLNTLPDDILRTFCVLTLKPHKCKEGIKNGNLEKEQKSEVVFFPLGIVSMSTALKGFVLFFL